MLLNKPSPYCWVQRPGYICGSQDQNPIVVIPNTWEDKGDTCESLLLAPDLQATFSDSPCIWTRNSVLILRAASLSFSLLEPQRESISSMKMMEGLCSRANVNRLLTSLEGRRGRTHWLILISPVLTGGKSHFSLSPNHLDTRSEEEMEKKVELLASVATALARYDFPVPGGPNRRMPLHGVRFPSQIQFHEVKVVFGTV